MSRQFAPTFSPEFRRAFGGLCTFFAGDYRSADDLCYDMVTEYTHAWTETERNKWFVLLNVARAHRAQFIGRRK